MGFVMSHRLLSFVFLIHCGYAFENVHLILEVGALKKVLLLDLLIGLVDSKELVQQILIILFELLQRIQ